MGNKWVRHLQRSENKELRPWPLLIRTFNQREDSTCIQTSTLEKDSIKSNYPLKVASWSCSTPDPDDTNNNTESVTLFRSDKCTLYIEYKLFGEDTFNLEVSSVEEAFALIEQDNSTTDNLFPNSPQCKWKRVL